MDLTTPSSDLTTFPAPGPLRPAGEPIPPRITGYPLVRLVDIEGHPVPDCERHTPTCPPDLTDPAEWPESNDVDGWYWETGPNQGDIAAASAALEDLPLPGLEPDAPDADPSIRFAGVAPLIERMGIAPIAGGAPETYEPSPTEWEAACAMFRDDDRAEQMRRWYAAHPLEQFNPTRTD